jgi:hypothetical protein
MARSSLSLAIFSTLLHTTPTHPIPFPETPMLKRLLPLALLLGLFTTPAAAWTSSPLTEQEATHLATLMHTLDAAADKADALSATVSGLNRSYVNGLKPKAADIQTRTDELQTLTQALHTSATELEIYANALNLRYAGGAGVWLGRSTWDITYTHVEITLLRATMLRQFLKEDSGTLMVLAAAAQLNAT